MARRLMDILKKDKCTPQEVGSVLRNKFHIRNKINEEIDGVTPLFYAVKNNRNASIIKELIKFGANVREKKEDNPYLIFMQAWRWILCTRGKNLDTIKLLLEHGALLNHGELRFAIRDCIFDEIIVQELDLEPFIPAIKLIFQYLKPSTKTEVFYEFCKHSIGRSNYFIYESERVLKDSIKLINLALKCGAQPGRCTFEGMFIYVLVLLGPNGYRALMNVFFVMDIFGIIVQHVFTKHFPKDLSGYNMKKQFEPMMNKLKKYFFTPHLYVAQIIYELLSQLTNSYLEECQNMHSDILSNGRSVLLTMQDFCDETFDKTSVSTDILYEILFKIVQNDYPLCTNILKKTIQNHEMIKLYAFLSKPQCGIISTLSFDCFSHVLNFLSEDDALNFLIAFVQPKKFK